MVAHENFPPQYGRALDALLRGSHLVNPDELPELAARCVRDLGVTELVMYLVDYDQKTLVPMRTAGTAPRETLSIDGTVAGRAFRTVTPQVVEAGASRRLWTPLLDGTERLGVIESVLPTEGADLEPVVVQMLSEYGHLVAELLVSKSASTDRYEWVRRERPMSLAAEMQYGLLPPLTFGTPRLVISGLLAPAYEVGGDAFDYAVNGEVAHVAVFDAMGHGLLAAQLSALAIGAYRNARRAGLPLQETALEVDRVLSEQHGGERFVTAILGQLLVDSGRLSWLSAGHPAPFLLRERKIVGMQVPEPSQPLGMLDLGGGAAPPVQETQLQPGDRVLLFTDGVDEARGRDGSFFGVQRLAEFVARQSASGEPTPEVMRRLQHAILEHQEGRLQDDATTLFVEWLTGKEQTLLP
ncbi:MAG: serine/threonine-protein phosphatase [Actinomycetota bacterium]|nr:serine/threonine-protein phosphatase [Actinomycetota bacterium]